MRRRVLSPAPRVHHRLFCLHGLLEGFGRIDGLGFIGFHFDPYSESITWFCTDPRGENDSLLIQKYDPFHQLLRAQQSQHL